MKLLKSVSALSAALTLGLILGGCAQVLDGLGMKGSEGKKGEDGKTIVMIPAPANITINYSAIDHPTGEYIILPSYLYTDTSPAPESVTLTNGTSARYTVSIRGLTGYIFDGITTSPGTLPELTASNLSSTTIDVGGSITFDVVMKLTTQGGIGDFYRKRFLIELQDEIGTTYAFEFEAQATLHS